MDIITRIFCSSVPHPGTGEERHAGGTVFVTRPGADLPPDFPAPPVPEKMLKESGSVAAFLCGGGRWFVKVSKYKGLRHALPRTFRVPRLFRSFSGAAELRQAGFHTPEALAAAVRYRFGIVPVQQMIVTEPLPENTVYLDPVFSGADPESVHAEFQRTVRFAARLHRAGFLHGDMSLRNLYRTADPEDFGMIDLDGIRHFPGSVPPDAAAAELARLAASAFRLMQPGADRDAWLADMLQICRQNGGAAVTAAEVRKTVDRLLKHRIHPQWKN